MIETIFHHGGDNIPVITFRVLPNGKFEIVDGKQRILSAIKPFVEDEFKLNGVYEDKFHGRTFSDIKEEYPLIANSFMGESLNVQIASDMTEEEARIYFIQINTSGVNMEIGEQIHGMQGTPLIKTIEELIKHPVWDYVQNIKRYGEYAYTSRMLLHTVNTESDKPLVHYTNKQLLDNLEVYYEIAPPKSAVTSLKKAWNIVHKICEKHKLCLNLREFYPLFIYVHKYMSSLDINAFGNFISGLYTNVHNKNPTGVFKAFKDQPHQQGYNYKNVQYYIWYINNVNYLYTRFLQGDSWDEIQRLSIKE